jgi:hypothetical protein
MFRPKYRYIGNLRLLLGGSACQPPSPPISATRLAGVSRQLTGIQTSTMVEEIKRWFGRRFNNSLAARFALLELL